jgi:hypothetical protein
MAISLANSYNINSTANTANQTITTASFTPATGELIVFKTASEDTQVPVAPSATGGGISWTKRVENLVPSTAYVAIWTAIVTAGGSAITISGTSSGSTPSYISMVIERWTGAQIAPSPAYAYANGTGAASASMTVTGSGSTISWVNGDWNAQSGSVTYTGGATQDGYQYQSGAYTAYYAYQTASAGAATIGMTAPTGQTYTIMGLEIQVSGQSNPTPGTLLTTGVGV